METLGAKETKWLNESANGILWSELKKLTGKTINTIVDKDGNYTDFIYDGMRIHSWFCNFGVNSDNEEPETPDITIPIYTFSKCPDLQKVAEILYTEKGINVITDDVLQIDEACKLAGLQSMNIIGELKNLGLRDWNKMEKIIKDVLKGMNEILAPEFKIYMNNLTHEIYIKPDSKTREEIINQTQLFKDKIKGIADFFHNDTTIKNKIKLAITEQKKSDTNDTDEKREKLNLLSSLL